MSALLKNMQQSELQFHRMEVRVVIFCGSLVSIRAQDILASGMHPKLCESVC